MVSFPILRPFLTETVPSAHRRTRQALAAGRGHGVDAGRGPAEEETDPRPDGEQVLGRRPAQDVGFRVEIELQRDVVAATASTRPHESPRVPRESVVHAGATRSPRRSGRSKRSSCGTFLLLDISRSLHHSWRRCCGRLVSLRASRRRGSRRSCY